MDVWNKCWKIEGIDCVCPQVVVSGLASTRHQLYTYMSSTFMAVSTEESVTRAITADCLAFLLDNEFICVQQMREEGGRWFLVFVCGHAHM